MADEQKRCPLCGEEAQYGQSGHSEIYRYEGCACGAYYAHDTELPMAGNEIKAGGYGRLPALLYERTLKGLPAPLLVFDQSKLSAAREKIDFAEPLSVDGLLAEWPRTAPERIDRCICNLGNYAERPDQIIKLNRDEDRKRTDVLFFTDHPNEERYFRVDYYVDALVQYRWVSHVRRDTHAWWLEITAEGWKRIGELAGGAERHRNPAFVAMWFGGKERKDKMDRLWVDFIKPAIEAAGYRAKRADADEHNEPIMDRVIAYIRRAPFVVAELSDDNNGVYYEAGFAKGRGIEVIYCCREEHKPHFDVTGINLVKWKDEADLRKRLEDRVIGSQDNGPYDYSELSRPLRAEDGASDDHS